MGGYINFAIRKDGKTRKVLSYTGVIPRMFNPSFYDGDEKVLQSALDLYEDCPDMRDGPLRMIAPFNYGLIVFDFDNKVVYDMQCAANIQMSHNNSRQRFEGYVWSAYQRGWLGKGLYNYDCELLSAFPSESFSSERDMSIWFLKLERELAGNIDDELVLNYATLPVWYLQPPEWVVCSFDDENGFSMRQALQHGGFDLSAEELKAWDDWISDKALRS